jgi:hypothetical protein
MSNLLQGFSSLLSHALQEILFFNIASPFPPQTPPQLQSRLLGHKSTFGRSSFICWEINTLLRDRDFLLYDLA